MMGPVHQIKSCRAEKGRQAGREGRGGGWKGRGGVEG